MTTHCSILAWETPWTEEPGGLQSRVAKGSDSTEQPNNRELIPVVVRRELTQHRKALTAQ